jgi:hypothetical protein
LPWGISAKSSPSLAVVRVGEEALDLEEVVVLEEALGQNDLEREPGALVGGRARGR